MACPASRSSVSTLIRSDDGQQLAHMLLASNCLPRASSPRLAPRCYLGRMSGGSPIIGDLVDMCTGHSSHATNVAEDMAEICWMITRTDVCSVEWEHV